MDISTREDKSQLYHSIAAQIDIKEIEPEKLRQLVHLLIKIGYSLCDDVTAASNLDSSAHMQSVWAQLLKQQEASAKITNDLVDFANQRMARLKHLYAIEEGGPDESK